MTVKPDPPPQVEVGRDGFSLEAASRLFQLFAAQTLPAGSMDTSVIIWMLPSNCRTRGGSVRNRSVSARSGLTASILCVKSRHMVTHYDAEFRREEATSAVSSYAKH
jgi:hypothetical protein